MSEMFNDWTVDFFKTEGGAGMTSQVAFVTLASVFLCFGLKSTQAIQT